MSVGISAHMFSPTQPHVSDSQITSFAPRLADDDGIRIAARTTVAIHDGGFGILVDNSHRLPSVFSPLNR